MWGNCWRPLLDSRTVGGMLVGLRVAREEGALAPGGGDLAARLVQLGIGRP